MTNNVLSLATIIALVACMYGTGYCQTTERSSNQETYYYGIEIGDVLCGYAEITLSSIEKDGRQWILLDEDVFAMLSALGSKFNTTQKIIYHIDPVSGNFSYHSNLIEQGQTKIDVEYTVDGDTATYTSTGQSEAEKVPLPAGTIRPNTMLFTFVKNDFADGELTEKEYQSLEVRDGQVQKVSISRVRDEQLELGGQKYSALVLDEMNKVTGLESKLWIDKKTGFLLKAALPNNRKIYRTDASVKKRIRVADMNESILVKTNKSISDIQGIRYLKVKADLDPYGLIVTEEGLNVRGQKFSGTVLDNHITGVFEVRHTHFDETDAPPFPCDYSGIPSLKPYLEDGRFLESDDPVLIEKAREIARGSATTWEAAVRLSRWVGKNIDYAIPGGGTARNTYDTRAGECGAHSLLLAAFCRGVGIPSRVVWGCMYVPNMGGGFGQHGWSEVYMGDAGWIPVDATAQEYDFVDSGHLRIGEMTSATISLNATSFEILDYQLATRSEAELEALSFDAYVGEYKHPEKEALFKVLEQNGKLALDIPKKMVLAFNDPDENGKWVCQLSAALALTFAKDDAGDVESMTICETSNMPRKGDPEQTSEETPEKYKTLVGKYLFQAINAEFNIIVEEGQLTLREPRGATYALEYSEKNGRWESRDGSRRIVFVEDDNGGVRSMRTTHASTFTKL